MLRSQLTLRQQQVLDYIVAEINRKGYPPSVREIGEAVGLSSSSTVHSHLAALERKGFVRRDPTKPRALEVTELCLSTRGINPERIRNLPLIGRVAAGSPLLAQENIEDTFAVPVEIAGDSSFMLRVSGESMIDAGIMNGDYIIVRQQETAINGDIVVALIDDEATVKRFYKTGNKVELRPENSTMRPIVVTELAILGIVTGLIRRF
jgi:repressor LexA